MKNIITRFAPSPSGNLHIGGIRIALYSWLFSRKYNGDFLLRIDNTDIKRSNIKYIKNIFYTLKWLKLNWDHSPIFQLKRINRYNSIINYMLNNNKAYFCVCGKKELLYKKNQNILKNNSFKYNRKCRDQYIDIKYILKNNIDYVIRFKNPLNGHVEFNDLIYGNIKIENKELDDFIIKRSNFLPTYNFCVSVDDNDFNITNVIRGSDHISNTPKQINIIKSINGIPPTYSHIPIILDVNKNKISKRNNFTDILEFKKNGILSYSILNYLFNIDFNKSDENKIYNLNNMINIFNIKNINKSQKIIDIKKIYYINKKIIQNMSLQNIEKELYIYIKNTNRKYTFVLNNKSIIKRIIKIYKKKCNFIIDFINFNYYIFNNFNINKEYKKLLNNEIILFLNKFTKKINYIKKWNETEIKYCVNDLLLDFDNLKLNNIGNIFRIILLNKKEGINIFSLIYILKKRQVIKKINNFIY